MNVWRLVIREILHRKVNFALSVVSVAAAAAVLVAVVALLDRHDRNTEQILAARQAETRERLDTLRADVQKLGAALNEDFRKITKGLGFNIFILPKDQDLGDFYAEGYASKFMPESYVTRLSQNKLVTVRHLLPILEQKVKWPEQGDRKILLVGTRGEVPIFGKDPKAAILDIVPRGGIVMGYELWKGLSLADGEKVKLLGRQFTVLKRHDERGTKDDITAWVNLAEAQEMLNLEGKINAILALECICAWADLPKVRAEIGRILPDTHIKETHSKALSRAETRDRAAEQARLSLRRAEQEADLAIGQARRGRARLRAQIERFAAVLAPLVVVSSAVWIGLLTWINVRRRRTEIGILRAIGTPSRQITGLFLARAVMVGLAGGAAGCLAGLGVALTAGEAPAGLRVGWAGVEPLMLVAVLAAAPALAALASWAPATIAARQDPTVALREE